MVKLLGALSDQLLARIVPRTEASAITCDWKFVCGYYCLARWCCTGPGINYCSTCQYTC